MIANLAKDVPVYFLRYEDSTMQANEIMTDLFRFMLDQPDITGTVLQHRIDEVTKESFEKRSAYKLKSNKTLNRNINLYTAE